MDDLTQAIQDLPLAGLIPVVLTIALGLILWAAGRRVLRAGVAAVGLLLGVGAGWIAGEILAVPPWAPAAVLGILLAGAAALLYRVPIAAALGLVFAVAAPLAVVTVAELQGRLDQPVETPAAGGPPPPAAAGPRSRSGALIDDANRWLFPEGDAADEPAEGASGDRSWGGFGGSSGQGAGASAEGGSKDRGGLLPGGIELPGEAGQALKGARSFATRVMDGFSAWWARIPEQLRPTLAASAVLGGLAGLLLGALAPSVSTSLVTAFGGALIWLSAARVLVLRVGGPLTDLLPDTATLSLVLWLVVALIGVAIQWTLRPRPADKPG